MQKEKVMIVTLMRSGGGVNVAQASVENVGTCPSMSRENSKRRTRKDESTDAKSRPWMKNGLRECLAKRFARRVFMMRT